jgi:hypothetical protein
MAGNGTGVTDGGGSVWFVWIGGRWVAGDAGKEVLA